MKRIFAFLIVTVLMLGIFAGCAEKELPETPVAKPTRLQLAGGQATILLPEGFYADRSVALGPNQIARYSCQDSYTLEIFQIARAGKDSLQSVAESRAQEKNVKAFQVQVEGTQFMCYTVQEMAEARMVTVVNYVVAAKQCFLEFSFHTDGKEQQMLAIGEFLKELKVN